MTSAWLSQTVKERDCAVWRPGIEAANRKFISGSLLKFFKASRHKLPLILLSLRLVLLTFRNVNRQNLSPLRSEVALLISKDDLRLLEQGKDFFEAGEQSISRTYGKLYLFSKERRENATSKLSSKAFSPTQVWLFQLLAPAKIVSPGMHETRIGGKKCFVKPTIFCRRGILPLAASLSNLLLGGCFWNVLRDHYTIAFWQLTLKSSRKVGSPCQSLSE